MKPRITLLTLGVASLERAVRFYREGLGWPSEGIVGTNIPNGAVAFFDLQPGLKLALWPRASIAHDTGLPETGHSATSHTIAHNVATRAQVQEVIALAVRAGATLVRAAHDTDWGGCSGYFQDPDGHVWEVAWNPAWTLPED